MATVLATAKAVEYPVAIRDKDLQQERALVVEIHEMCTQCGERFGIGYLQAPGQSHRCGLENEELPDKLKQILSNDHRHNRQHKHVIQLDD